MSKIEVLVTTMNQNNFSKYQLMNLQTDAILANQTDKDDYEEQIINGCDVHLISTKSRGLSRNRNIALAHCNQNAEYVVFADDDLVFVDGYERLILKEFNKHPEAEAIKFNLHDLSNERKISMKRIDRFEKATRRNMSSSGVCVVVVKTKCIKEYNLHFHENFGAGTENYCGEDTIFLMDMLNKGVKFYRSPIDIAGIDQTESSWFTGHDERYFTTAGMVIGSIYPLLSYLIAVRSSYKLSRRKDIEFSFLKILKCYFNGIKKHV